MVTKLHFPPSKTIFFTSVSNWLCKIRPADLNLKRITHIYLPIYIHTYKHKLLKFEMQPLKCTAWENYLPSHGGNWGLQTHSKIEEFFPRMPVAYYTEHSRDRESNWLESPGTPILGPAHRSPFPSTTRPIRCEPVPARGPASQQRARLQAGPPGGAHAQLRSPLQPKRSIANPPPPPPNSGGSALPGLRP